MLKKSSTYFYDNLVANAMKGKDNDSKE